MDDPQPEPGAERPRAQIGPSVRLCFGLFGVFFLFYVGAALFQSPANAEMAMTKVGGFPIGVLVSLAVFPVSWILIAIWFKKGR